jgi:lambda repressor-like predicted transcriptional regulator
MPTLSLGAAAIAAKDADIAMLKALAKSGGLSLEALKSAIDASEREGSQLLAQGE